MADSARLKYSVTATDESATTLKKVGKNIDDLGKNAGKNIDLSSITDSLSIGGMGDMLGGALGVAGLGAAAVGVAAVSWELGKAGATTLRVRDSFADMAGKAGTSADSMLAAMKKATAGTVNDSDLMLAANRALMLGVVTNSEDMAGLMAAAIERGRTLGVGAAQAVDTIIQGIGKMSPERLDDLGITGVTAQVEAYAATLGKTSDQLTDVQKKQALVNAVLASSSGGAVANDAAAAFERMDVSLANAKESLGVLFSPAISAIANQLADTVTRLTNDMERGAKADAFANLSGLSETLQMGMAELQGWQDAMAVAQIGGDSAQISEAEMQLARVAGALADVGAKYNVAAAATGAPLLDIGQLQNGVIAFQTLSVAITGAGTAATGADPQLVSMAAGLGLIGQMALAAATDVATFKAEVARLTGVASAIKSARDSAISQAMATGQRAIDAGGDPEAVTAMVGDTADAVNGLILSTDQSAEAQFRNKLAVEASLGGLQEYTTGLEDTNRAATKLASGGLSDMDAKFNDLKGKVSGVLGQSLNLSADWEGKSANAGNHDTSENAYRMAAIANEGLIGQDWLGDLANEAPAAYKELMDKIASGMDAKSAAQSIMADFQDGMTLDLVNPDAVKDRVRRMILGEQSTAELANQIAQELSTEMGISLASAQAAAGAVMGIKPTTDTAGLAEGLSQATNGKALIGQIAAQMEAAAERMRTAGNSAGAVWGVGFMATVETSVATPLINMLVALVTPGVMAAIAAQNSQNGAK